MKFEKIIHCRLLIINSLEKMIDKEELLEKKLKENEEHIKRLVNENITLVTENMKLAYENKKLTRRIANLEIFSQGYSMHGLSENRDDYAVILIKKEKDKYLN